MSTSNTSNWHKLCSVAEIKEQTAKRFSIPGFDDIAICHLGDGFYAVSDTCTHGVASLSQGFIEEGQIVCPLHKGAFDIVTGKATRRPCKIPIKTYKVVIEGDDLFIEQP